MQYQKLSILLLLLAVNPRGVTGEQMSFNYSEDLLWHYTSFEVLLSIFGQHNPAMRAIHIDFLNDKSEFEYGSEFVKSAVSRQGLDIQFPTNRPEIYTFSLSKAENALYQWLVYNPQNGGVSLGFRNFECSIPFNSTQLLIVLLVHQLIRLSILINQS